jgi:hypothetical protein
MPISLGASLCTLFVAYTMRAQCKKSSTRSLSRPPQPLPSHAPRHHGAVACAHRRPLLRSASPAAPSSAAARAPPSGTSAATRRPFAPMLKNSALPSASCSEYPELCCGLPHASRKNVCARGACVTLRAGNSALQLKASSCVFRASGVSAVPECCAHLCGKQVFQRQACYAAPRRQAAVLLV